jgi:hypothetical protein
VAFNVAFNVARNAAFIAMVRATSTVSFEYIPPMYHAMQTKHIEGEVSKSGD